MTLAPLASSSPRRLSPTSTAPAVMNDLVAKATAQCTAILQHHSNPPPTASSSTSPPEDLPPITDVRHDFVVLAQAIGKESTALSLACKPPVSLAAAQGTVANITNLLLKLEVCLLACPAKGALAKEIKCVGTALRALFC